MVELIPFQVILRRDYYDHLKRVCANSGIEQSIEIAIREYLALPVEVRHTEADRQIPIVTTPDGGDSIEVKTILIPDDLVEKLMPYWDNGSLYRIINAAIRLWLKKKEITVQP